MEDRFSKGLVSAIANGVLVIVVIVCYQSAKLSAGPLLALALLTVISTLGGIVGAIVGTIITSDKDFPKFVRENAVVIGTGIGVIMASWVALWIGT